MTRKDFSGLGALFQNPFGAVVVANLVWHVVVWAAGIKFNALVSVFLFLIDLAVASFLLDRLTYFFAQFVLPVQNPKQRQEIYERVRDFETGRRGPALFIKNGQVIAHEGELERKGPGLIVADTASAAVLRADSDWGAVVGPGVNLIKANERIERSVDLRPRWQYIGPEGGGERTDAVTRDEVEIKATISVKFSIRRPKQKRPSPNGVTSEYGYDEEAVRRAVVNEFIEVGQDKRTLISWEEIPADLVVGVWREYVHKFKLMELFTPLNGSGKTGLQMIEEMMNKRVTQPNVENMDSIGNLTQDWTLSPEYEQLQRHGLEISEVRIHNVHLAEADEKPIIEQWKPEWLKSIQEEEKNLANAKALITTNAREESNRRLANLISEQFQADESALNPFQTLEKLMKPMREFVLEQSAAGNDMEARLRKMNDLWKWLIDHDAEFQRMQEGRK